jgi:hypothetical protein
MNPRTIPPSHGNLRYWMFAVLLFGAGFGIVWQCSRARAPLRVTSSRAASVQPPGAQPRSSAGAASRRLTELGAELDGIARAMNPAPITTAIRKSRLPEWMRFRYEHSTLALSTEMAVRWILDKPLPMRDFVTACASKEHTPSVFVDMSAEIEIRGRDATVRGWGCDSTTDDMAAGRICECLLEHLPSESHVVVPPEVADTDLAPYEGMLSIQL